MWFLAGAREFSLVQISQTSSATHPVQSPIQWILEAVPGGKAYWRLSPVVKRVGVKLTTCPGLVLSVSVPVLVTLNFVLKVIVSLVSKCVDI
jgi:hypothetical protein